MPHRTEIANLNTLIQQPLSNSGSHFNGISFPMRIISICLSFVCFLALTGCLDEQERAQEHYERALTLFEDGEPTKAMLELRNALQSDGLHKEARRLYADNLLEQNDAQGAYSQYLRLIEQYPNTVEVRRLLAEISLDTGNWPEVERHGRAALELALDDPANLAIVAILDYRNATVNDDPVAVAASVADARELLAAHPDLDTALRLLVDWEATGPAPERALPYLNRLLERHPDSQSLMMARLRVLDTAGMDDEIGASLKTIYERFPEDTVFSDLLLQWYLSRDENDAAEAFLRQKAGADDAPAEGHFAVIRLIEESQGSVSALVELDRLADANQGTDLGRRYAAQSALKRFEIGDFQQISIMETYVDDMQDAGLKNDGRFVLASMYRAVGNEDRGRALVATILENDPSHVNALTARAAFFIEDGDPTAAVNDLRSALDQSPRNTDVLLVLAGAQQRLGNIELAEQRLAQAVEFSDGASRAALAYAGFLSGLGNLTGAERVLSDSLSTGNLNLEVAATLAEIQLALGDTEGARVLLAQLVAADLPGTETLIRDMQATILFNENRIEDSLQFLRSSLDEDGDGTDDLGVELHMLRIQMLSGNFDDARAELETLRARFPDATALRLIEGNLLALEGRSDEAIAVFRALLDEDRDQIIVIQRLYSLLRRAGQFDAASDLLQQSLNGQPASRPLLLMSALELEQKGSVDEALETYEALYAIDSNSLTIANNYASMLAYYRDDDASLALASTIAAPLTGSNNPAFLDTLGYIKMRQGALDDAILNFQAAARGLPDNPTVAFNLAEAYEKAGRTQDALAEVERGLALAQDAPDVLKLEDARRLYDMLQLAQANEL